MKKTSVLVRACVVLWVMFAGMGAVLAEEVGRDDQSLWLRPSDAADPQGYQGASARWTASPEGHVRVWWATEGPHAPVLTDANANDVPDYVDLVARISDEVLAHMAQSGWRKPLVDNSTTPAGDTAARLDVYLVHFQGGDGNFRIDRCMSALGQQVCAGHLRIENDFRPLHYPTHEYALRVVVAHELFHGVQFAYRDEIDTWWSEGASTWYEESFYPLQADFERLANDYLKTPERTLHDRQRGPTDAFAYGAGLFVYFLEQHIGVEGLVAVHEAMGRGLKAIEAVAEVLASRQWSLAEAFEQFAVWNVFTGSRALAGAGYGQAGQLAAIPLVALDVGAALNWDVRAEPMAARVAELIGLEPVAVSLAPHEGFIPAKVAIVDPVEFAASQSYEVIEGFEPVRVMLGPGERRYLVVTNGDLGEEAAIRVKIRKAPATPDSGTPEQGTDAGGERAESDAGGPLASEQGQSSGDGACRVADSQGPVSVWWLVATAVFSVASRRRWCTKSAP